MNRYLLFFISLCVPSILTITMAVAQTSQQSKQPDSANGMIPLPQILHQIEQAGKNLIDLKADFHQVKVFTLFEDKTESSGKLIYKKSGKILWEFEKPDPSKLIINKNTAWLYVPKIKQVQKVNLKDRARTESILIGFGTSAAEIQETYEISFLGIDKIDQRKVYILELIPKSKDLSSYFSKITLWIEGERWIPVKTQLLEHNEDITTLFFSAIQLNTQVADDLFNFKIPGDVEVVDYSQ